jgi:hypothetical protein
MIFLRDLPGVGVLEWEVEQHGWTDEAEEWAHDLSEELFGISGHDTYPALEEDGRLTLAGSLREEKGEAALEVAREWKDHFQPLRMFRDEADSFWSSCGWDVTDGNGKQLAVMEYLGRSLICVVKKLHPAAGFTVSDEALEARLAEEARRFKA